MSSILQFLFNSNFWWTIRVFLGVAAIVLLLGLIKRKQVYIVIFGLLLLIAAFPAGLILDVATYGCCGGSSSGGGGVGLTVGIIMATVGLVIIAGSKKMAKKSVS